MKGQGEFSFDIDRVDLENLDSLKDVSNIKLGKSIKRI
jgi:hypothetical protein